MQFPFLHPSKKASLSPSVWVRREYTWTLSWKKSLLTFKIPWMFPIPSSRNRMMNTYLIVNINPLSPEIVYKMRLCFSPFQKALPSPFSLARNKIYLGTHLKEELTNLFWKLTGYSLFSHRQSTWQEFEHFANMVKIITLYVRDSLEDKKYMLFTHLYLM